MKTIAITGANGFVGTNLQRFFSALGYKIIPISRDILNNNEKLKETLNQTDIVINLAGANNHKDQQQNYQMSVLALFFYHL